MNDAIRIFGFLHDKADPPDSGNNRGLKANPCEWPDCDADCVHRTRQGPRDVARALWLCRLHAREHNTNWDYFQGMSREQIDRFRNDDTTWHRPTWKLNPNNGTWWQDRRFGDDWFDFDDRPSPDNPGTHTGRTTGSNDPVLNAFTILELDCDATWGEAKARYKELVKRHHPDANGGCKKAENRLKEVNRAYGILKKWYEQ